MPSTVAECVEYIDLADSMALQLWSIPFMKVYNIEYCDVYIEVSQYSIASQGNEWLKYLD